MNKALLNKEVQDFLVKNQDKDVVKIALKGSPFKKVQPSELAIQLSGRQKAKDKLPTWFANKGILYPPNLNLEQSSSEITAQYKASLVEGRLLVDLTGGFGVDSYYFSKKFKKVVHCEIDTDLSEIVAHNAQQLQADTMEFYLGDGFNFLGSATEAIDWIYIDPSRRDTAGGRVYQLSDCLPDVPRALPDLLEKAPKILLKTSPLLDFQAGITALEVVQEIHVVAVKNEVKELLWILGRTPAKNIRIKTLNFNFDELEFYENDFGKDHPVTYGPPSTYLYEPNAAIMKSRLMDGLAVALNLKKLHPNSQLFTSSERLEFQGRRFRIENVLPYSPKHLKPVLKALGRGNITTRNFEVTVENLRKQFKLKDGGDNYLFFTTLQGGQRVLILCKKVD